MLAKLKVSGFLLIDKLDLDFNSGLTVITGETGSGKSIIIEALLILFGAKLSSLREISQVANFEAQFDLSCQSVQKWLVENDLADIDNNTNLICRRVIDSSGKSKCYINGNAATLGQLKILGDIVLAIHTQNSAISLLNNTTQRNLLDKYANTSDLVSRLHNYYLQIIHKQQQIQEYYEQNKARAELIETMGQKLADLESLAVGANEWQQLQDDHKRLNNVVLITQALNESSDLLLGSDIGIAKIVRKARNKLNNIAEYLPQVDNLLQILDSMEVELDEIYSQIDVLASNLHDDPNLLSYLDSRIGEIFDVSRKYKINPEDITLVIPQLKTQLSNLVENNNLDELNNQLEQLKLSYTKLAKQVSKDRAKGALKLAETVNSLLGQLFITGEFTIQLTPTADIASYGLEDIEYMVSFNKGLSIKPLSKAASGGELSRVALSLYLVLSNYSDAEIIVFDEIDVGVGGKVASAIGGMLRRLAQSKQVLSITHHAQSASFGERHLVVSKSSNQSTTISQVKYIDNDERILEMARMLSSSSTTQISLQHAQEMLELAKGGN